jgi:hypothetical protein
MGCLIGTCIAGQLMLADIIAADTFMTIVAVLLFCEPIAPVLYFRLGWFKFFYHNMLGWHRPANAILWNDGCSQRSVCKHCGRDIMQDSQGNWFTY